MFTIYSPQLFCRIFLNYLEQYLTFHDFDNLKCNWTVENQNVILPKFKKWNYIIFINIQKNVVITIRMSGIQICLWNHSISIVNIGKIDLETGIQRKTWCFLFFYSRENVLFSSCACRNKLLPVLFCKVARFYSMQNAPSSFNFIYTD